MKGYKKIGIVSAFSVFVFICITAGAPTNKADDGFKNLQVLPKNISKDSLDAIMDGFKHALGVHCTFCHAPDKNNPKGWPDFASDDKPEKNIARHMMRMTSDINKNYFNWNNSAQPDTIREVNCVTCHRGNPHPDEVGMMNKDSIPHPMPGMPIIPANPPAQH